MPLTLAKIANNTAQIHLKWGDDELHVVYYPARVTEKTITDVLTFTSMDSSNYTDGFSSLNNILCQLIKSWDLYEDDAQTQAYPLSPDRLAELPFLFRTEVITAILKDVRPETVAPQSQQS